MCKSSDLHTYPCHDTDICGQCHNYPEAELFIIKMAKRKYQQEIPHLDIDALVLEGRNLGQQAAWMPAIRWEDRLSESLENVRNELGFAPPTAYQNSKMSQSELFATA